MPSIQCTSIGMRAGNCDKLGGIFKPVKQT